MSSFSSTAVAFILRKTGIFKRMFSGGDYVTKNLAKLRATASAPAAKWHKRVDVTQAVFEGRQVYHFTPKAGAAKGCLLYFHGGGYVYTASALHWDFLGHLAHVHGIRVIAPLYPLAPEVHIDAIVDFGVALYRDALKTYDAGDVVIGGDSAGGGLTVSTIAAARAQGLPTPAGAVLICPWLHAGAPHPDQLEIDPRDPILSVKGIRSIGTLLAPGRDVDDPLLSPINADLSDFPPTLMFGGGDDILVSDARALKAKLPDIEYHEAKRQMHVWPVFFFPESRGAQAQIAAFVKRVTG